jgi:chaperonin GroEL (HSP60 family)
MEIPIMSGRFSNLQACCAINGILKTSLGPKVRHLLRVLFKTQGMDKMIMDEFGDVIVTNDGATILKKLKVEHPAAKIIVDLAISQDVRAHL